MCFHSNKCNKSGLIMSVRGTARITLYRICNVFSTVIMVAEPLVTGYGLLHSRPKIEIFPLHVQYGSGDCVGKSLQDKPSSKKITHCNRKRLLFGQTCYVVWFDCTCLAVVVPTCYLTAHPVLGVSCDRLVPWWLCKHSKTNMKKMRLCTMQACQL